MKYFTKLGDLERELRFERRGDQLLVHGDGRVQYIELAAVGDGTFALLVDGQSLDVLIERRGGAIVVQARGQRFAVVVEDERERAAHAVAGVRAAGPRELRAVMPGVVVNVLVAEGDAVEQGQTLLVLEAMKMQNPLAADGPGRVKRLLARAGEAVAGGALLLELE